MNLIELESLIHNLARIYSSTNNQLTNLEIVGRIAAWRCIDDLSASSADELRKIIEPIISSYSENHGIKSKDGSIIDIVSLPRSELALSLKRRLENRYGKTNARYLLEKEDHPSDVVRALVRTALVEVAHSRPIHMLDYAYMDFFRECGLEDIIWTFYLGDPVKAVLDSFPL